MRMLLRMSSLDSSVVRVMNEKSFSTSDLVSDGISTSQPSL